MQVNLRMRFEKVFHGLTLVSREVVCDHMDFFATSLVGDDIGEEGNELGRGMTCRSLAKNLARFSVERRVQRQRVPWR